jgi:hypothetical protein
MILNIPLATSMSVLPCVLSDFSADRSVGFCGDFSGEENTPSMFSMPKLSLGFSGSVMPVRLHSIVSIHQGHNLEFVGRTGLALRLQSTGRHCPAFCAHAP